LRKVKGLKKQVLSAVRREHYRTGKSLTDLEAEDLPEFLHWRPSSVRKRMGELRQLGFIRWTGEKRNGANISVPVPITEIVERELPY